MSSSIRVQLPSSLSPPVLASSPPPPCPARKTPIPSSPAPSAASSLSPRARILSSSLSHQPSTGGKQGRSAAPICPRSERGGEKRRGRRPPILGGSGPVALDLREERQGGARGEERRSSWGRGGAWGEDGGSREAAHLLPWRCCGGTARPSATPASTPPSRSFSQARPTGSSGSGIRRATAPSPPSGLMAARLGCIRSLLAPGMGTRSSAREGMVCAKAGGLRKLGSHGGPYLQSKQVHTISVRCHWLRFHGLHMAHNLA